MIEESARQQTRAAVMRLLRDQGPNGVTPADCGPFSEQVAAFYSAWEQGGLDAVRSTLRVIVAAETASDGRSPLLEALCAPDVAARLPRVLKPHELKLLPPARCLIAPYLPLNRLVMLFGKSGIGKSFINLDVALTVSQFTNVLYIPTEAIDEYEERQDAWEQHHRRSAGSIHYWNDRFNLMDPGLMDEVVAEALAHRDQLIIIDTLADAMPDGDDREGRDVKQALKGLHRLREATRACIYLSHHSGWDLSRERGHSSLRASCRVVMKLDGQMDDVITLTVDKINGARPPPPRRFSMIPSGRSIVPVPVAQTTKRDGKPSARQLEVIEVIRLGVFKDGARHSDLVNHCGISNSTMNYTLSRLMELGMIYQDGKKRVFLTEKGEAFGLDPEPEPSTLPASAGGRRDSLYWSVDPANCHPAAGEDGEHMPGELLEALDGA